MSTLDLDREMLRLAEATIPNRAEGEPLFPLAWHARIFALIVTLVKNRHIPWIAFQKHLVTALKRHQRPDMSLSAEEINLQYFDCWLEAAEETLTAEGFVGPNDVVEQIERIRASVAKIREGQLSNHTGPAH